MRVVCTTPIPYGILVEDQFKAGRMRSTLGRLHLKRGDEGIQMLEEVVKELGYGEVVEWVPTKATVDNTPYVLKAEAT